MCVFWLEITCEAHIKKKLLFFQGVNVIVSNIFFVFKIKCNKKDPFQIITPLPAPWEFKGGGRCARSQFFPSLGGGGKGGI